MKIEINIEQANALLILLDIAVKADGLRSAQNALFFRDLIHDAAKASSDIGTVPVATVTPPDDNAPR